MDQDININVKMRLIGYYMRDNQFMRTEEIYPEKAEELASLLEKTFQTILENRFVSDDMRTVFNGNTVFILKSEDKHLYGYYPKYNVARITKVRYVKPDVVPFPYIYKRWFFPGERFHLYKPKEEKEILPSIPDSSI